MACGCGQINRTVETVQQAQANADARRAANTEQVRQEQQSQVNAQANASS